MIWLMCSHRRQSACNHCLRALKACGSAVTIRLAPAADDGLGVGVPQVHGKASPRRNGAPRGRCPFRPCPECRNRFPAAASTRGRGLADGLHAVVIGGNAVDKVEGFGALLCSEHLDRDLIGKRLSWAQSARFFSILPQGLPRFSKALQRLLERLGHHALVDHAPAQVDDLIDVFDKQRALLLAGAAGGAGPDLIFAVEGRRSGVRRCGVMSPRSG